MTKTDMLNLTVIRDKNDISVITEITDKTDITDKNEKLT